MADERVKIPWDYPDWWDYEEFVGRTRLPGPPRYTIAEQRRRGPWWKRLARWMRGEPPVDFRSKPPPPTPAA